MTLLLCRIFTVTLLYWMVQNIYPCLDFRIWVSSKMFMPESTKNGFEWVSYQQNSFSIEVNHIYKPTNHLKIEILSNKLVPSRKRFFFKVNKFKLCFLYIVFPSLFYRINKRGLNGRLTLDKFLSLKHLVADIKCFMQPIHINSVVW